MKRETRDKVLSGACGALVGALLCVVSALESECTPQQAATAGGVISELDGATCTELELQPEPAWVTFACSVLDPTGKAAAKTSTWKVKKADAAAFAAGHCPKTSGGNPTP